MQSISLLQYYKVSNSRNQIDACGDLKPGHSPKCEHIAINGRCGTLYGCVAIPAKKTKIYAYIETQFGKTRSQKKLIKDPNRDYENTQHWNLDAEYLAPLKEFKIRNMEQ